MNLKIIYALILTILPVSELRIGLPLALTYAFEESIPIILIFSIVVLLNILLVFFVFYFLDNLHKILMEVKIYQRFFRFYLRKIQGKIDKFEKRYASQGFIALAIFVAVPLPGTGAWSGCLVAWLLGLERKKSILAISTGVFVAGVLILLGTLGFFKIF